MMNNKIYKILSTAFCDSCLTPVHNHQRRRDHKPTRLGVPQEYLQHM